MIMEVLIYVEFQNIDTLNPRSVILINTENA